MTKRTPITGIIRNPIIGIQRNPVKFLNWDTIYENLVNYIKYASKQVASQYHTEGWLSVEDLYQEGQLLLYHCFEMYKAKPMNEFEALFKASLWRKLREIGKKPEFTTVDIEDAFDIGYNEDVTENMYQEFKLQQMAEMLESTPIALTILKEFINPSMRTLWEASMNVARKQMLKDQEFAVSVPKSVTIKATHIQRALEIPKSLFAENFQIVKNIVGKVYEVDGKIGEELMDEAM